MFIFRRHECEQVSLQRLWMKMNAVNKAGFLVLVVLLNISRGVRVIIFVLTYVYLVYSQSASYCRLAFD